MCTIIAKFSSVSAAYMDDVIIYRIKKDNHRTHLCFILHTLREAGQTIKNSKCQLAPKTCTYLGNIVGEGQVCLEMAKFAAIHQFPITKRKKTSNFTQAGQLLSPLYSFILLQSCTPHKPHKKEAPNHQHWNGHLLI